MPIIDGEEIIKLREIIREVPMADAVKEYALKVILATHPELPEGHEMAKKYIEVGASPRAAQGLFGGAKVRAIMEGILLELMYEIPDMKDVTEVIITDKVINGEGEAILVRSTDSKTA